MSPDPLERARRAVPKVVLFWGVYVAVLLLAGMAKGWVSAAWSALAWGVASSVVLLGWTHLCLAREGRGAAQVGLGASAMTPLRFGAGLTLGLAVYALTLLSVSVLAGPIELARAPAPGLSTVCLTVATSLALVTMEELGFRAYPLWTLLRSLGRWRAQALVALAFAGCHLLYGWTWQTVLLGVLPCAVLFGAAALASGGLAMPIGVHLGLNLARWAAGETDTPGLWTLVVAEPLQERVAGVAPFVGLALPLLASAALWRCKPGGRARSGSSTG